MHVRGHLGGARCKQRFVAFGSHRQGEREAPRRHDRRVEHLPARPVRLQRGRHGLRSSRHLFGPGIAQRPLPFAGGRRSRRQGARRHRQQREPRQTGALSLQPGRHVVRLLRHLGRARSVQRDLAFRRPRCCQLQVLGRHEQCSQRPEAGALPVSGSRFRRLLHVRGHLGRARREQRWSSIGGHRRGCGKAPRRHRRRLRKRVGCRPPPWSLSLQP